ncbi:MAG TPA: hypothetical protein VFO34_02330 [Candidatus Acidoferrales bacterium]|nr:hypothetical protein [Candidatus Acidoferrales bacterium]
MNLRRNFHRLLGFSVAVILSAAVLSPQQNPAPVSIEVRADQPQGSLAPIWNYFGYDEPNFTYAPNGKKLLGELSALSRAPVYARTHNLFTSGDGSASLKWGSTNVYTEDAVGNPVYSWEILDRIFDTYREKGIKPLVEIGFMPEALSTHPEPYRHNFPNGSIYTGWTYPPKDYQKWAGLVFQFVRHLRQRYGDAELKSWLWEVWNEPDIAYWRGTPEEYFKLYDITVDAALRAFPSARIGGPDSTGASYPKAAEFLRQFLEHCAHQKNYVTGRIGSHLDFISFHPKGSPAWRNDHVEMGISRQLASIEAGFKIVASFPEYQRTPVVLGESDPDGCAGCAASRDPQYGYRNTSLFAAYVAEAIASTYALAAETKVNLLGSVTWSFEFENQPYFEGYRELATNGLDKPVLNTFRMFGLLSGNRVALKSSAALPVEEMIRSGVRGASDVNGIATRGERSIEILLWNYHDDDVLAPDAPISLKIEGLPLAAKNALVEHFRVDPTHSNSYTAWKGMGSPQNPSQVEYESLEHAGHLQLLDSPEWKSVDGGTVKLEFPLPRESVSLLRISW